MSYFSQVQTLGLTIFGLVAGVLMRFLKGYKVGLDITPFETRLTPRPARFDQRSFDPPPVRLTRVSRFILD